MQIKKPLLTHKLEHEPPFFIAVQMQLECNKSLSLKSPNDAWKHLLCDGPISDAFQGVPQFKPGIEIPLPLDNIIRSWERPRSVNSPCESEFVLSSFLRILGGNYDPGNMRLKKIASCIIFSRTLSLSHSRSTQHRTEILSDCKFSNCLRNNIL